MIDRTLLFIAVFAIVAFFGIFIPSFAFFIKLFLAPLKKDLANIKKLLSNGDTNKKVEKMESELKALILQKKG